MVHPFSTSTLRPRAPRHYWRRSPNRGAGRAAGRPLRSLPQGATADADGVGCWHRHDSDHPCCASRLKTLSPTPAPQSKPVERPFLRQAPLPAARLARDTESPHEVLWDLYVEPATPSLPSMGRFTRRALRPTRSRGERRCVQSEVARSAVVLAMRTHLRGRRKGNQGAAGSSLVEVEPVSDCDRFAATATPNLARRWRMCTLAVFSVLKSAWLLRASWVACRRCGQGCCSGSVKGPDRPLLFAPTGAGREPLQLR